MGKASSKRKIDIDTIEQLVESCTVKIASHNAHGNHGTGFFITPGIILTCAHVVESNSKDDIWCLIRGKENHIAAKLIYSFRPEVDLAILQIKDRSSTPFCAYIGDGIHSRDSCFSFGYTMNERGNSDGDPVTLECEGLAGKDREIIKLKGGQILPGMSGAPLLNHRTGEVCGIIKNTRGRHGAFGGDTNSL